MITSLIFFWSDLSPMMWFGLKLAQVAAFVLILSVILAFLILMDRKVWAAVQMRRGPNVVGPFGLLQSFADLLKFVFKEIIIPAGSDKSLFILAPLITCNGIPGLGCCANCAGMGNVRHKCWCPLCIGNILARCIWYYYRWVGVKFQVSIHGGFAIYSPNDFL